MARQTHTHTHTHTGAAVEPLAPTETKNETGLRADRFKHVSSGVLLNVGPVCRHRPGKLWFPVPPSCCLSEKVLAALSPAPPCMSAAVAAGGPSVEPAPGRAAGRQRGVGTPPRDVEITAYGDLATNASATCTSELGERPAKLVLRHAEGATVLLNSSLHLVWQVDGDYAGPATYHQVPVLAPHLPLAKTFHRRAQ